jgi:hypothetical protein
MLTLNITNTSGTDIVAGDGVLPNMLDWLSIADAANADAVFQVHDMNRIENYHSGFTMGELLDQLKQRGLITMNVTDVGDSEDVGSMPDHVVATAA